MATQLCRTIPHIPAISLVPPVVFPTPNCLYCLKPPVLCGCFFKNSAPAACRVFFSLLVIFFCVVLSVPAFFSHRLPRSRASYHFGRECKKCFVFSCSYRIDPYIPVHGICTVRALEMTKKAGCDSNSCSIEASSKNLLRKIRVGYCCKVPLEKTCVRRAVATWSTSNKMSLAI